LSVDPLAPYYPELTPYQFAHNCPIWLIDLDGLEGAEPEVLEKEGKIKEPELKKPNSDDIKKKLPKSHSSKPKYRKPGGGRPIFKPKGPRGHPLITIAEYAFDLTQFFIEESIETGRYIAEMEQAMEDDLAKKVEEGTENQEGPYYYEPSWMKKAKEKEKKRDPQKTIGLGVDEDLGKHRFKAIIYKNAGWQVNKLTRVDWGRAMMSEYYFQQSFDEAAANAEHIRFELTNYTTDPKRPMTKYELNEVTSKPELLNKTTFIVDGQEYEGAEGWDQIKEDYQEP
jgi:hypothetical protein